MARQVALNPSLTVLIAPGRNGVFMLTPDQSGHFTSGFGALVESVLTGNRSEGADRRFWPFTRWSDEPGDHPPRWFRQLSPSYLQRIHLHRPVRSPQRTTPNWSRTILADCEAFPERRSQGRPVVERRLIPAREGVVVLLVGGMAARLAGLGRS
jgi:hypothetical protein